MLKVWIYTAMAEAAAITIKIPTHTGVKIGKTEFEMFTGTKPNISTMLNF